MESEIILKGIKKLVLDTLDNSKTSQAVAYSLKDYKAGYYRPKIILAVGKVVGFKEKELLETAIGVECIHNASLIFDDMPFMDDALIRRDRKCTHLKFGLDISTLAGLYLLNKGISLMVSNAHRHNKVKEVNDELSKTLNFKGLIGGQETDLIKFKKFNKKSIFEMYFKKNSLMNFSIIIPSILNNDKYIEGLRKIGRKISIAYQIQDDFKDFIKDSNKIKKSKKQNERLVDFIGITEAEKIKKRFLNEALEEIEKLPNSKSMRKLIEKFFSKRYLL